MLLITLFAIALATLIGFARWRSVFFLLAVVAAFQDPLRKLTEGTPGWMTLLPVPVFLAAILSSRARVPTWWSEFARSNRKIAERLYLWIFLSIPAALISITYGPGSWMYTVLGVFSYSLMILSIIMGFHFARGVEVVRSLLVFYVGLHSVMLSGAVFQYLGWYQEWLVLGDKALGYEWVRFIPGYQIRLISGFYRSADVLGWHAATVCMIGMILAFSESGRARWFWILISAWAIFALFVCGRRKMVYMIPIFLMTVVWIYFYIGRAARVLPMIGFLVIPLISVYYVSDFLGEESGQIQYYTSAPEGDSAYDRLAGQGFGAAVVTLQQSGFFGMGLGFATPGSHHIKASRPRVWQESGTSRLVAELGLPGFLGFLALVVAMVSTLWKITRAHLRARTPSGIFAAGLLSMFVANLGSLAVSGQILADSFVVIFIGALVGIVLGFRRPEFMPAEITARLANEDDPEAGYRGRSTRPAV